jgi:hypothetical protein
MFQHIVAAVAATSFLCGQDFHDSWARSLKISTEIKQGETQSYATKDIHRK